MRMENRKIVLPENVKKMKEENNDLQMQIVKLETEMKNRRR